MGMFLQIFPWERKPAQNNLYISGRLPEKQKQLKSTKEIPIRQMPMGSHLACCLWVVIDPLA